MNKHIITSELIQAYEAYLYREEQAQNTIIKYVHDLQQFANWLDGQALTKEQITTWKTHLTNMGRSAGTINNSIAAIHHFLKFMHWQDCSVHYLKRQKQLFRDDSKALSRAEYMRLVATAEAQSNTRLALLLETICSTGIRVSEVQYITVETLMKGRAEISLKGKIRTILIPKKLAKKLRQYAKAHNITSGQIFITKNGNAMSRHQIWREMKRLCQAAGVEESKVFPHNLRHLFARSYYQQYKDVVQLADILGHSSVETTRIYLMTTVEEHSKYLDKLGLVS